jgi:hypothetical protein
VILEEICVRCTCHSVPPGHVLLQNYPSFIPEESQNNLPADGCVRNFFGFGEEVWRHSLFTFLVPGCW